MDAARTAMPQKRHWARASSTRSESCVSIDDHHRSPFPYRFLGDCYGTPLLAFVVNHNYPRIIAGGSESTYAFAQFRLTGSGRRVGYSGARGASPASVTFPDCHNSTLVVTLAPWRQAMLRLASTFRRSKSVASGEGVGRP